VLVQTAALKHYVKVIPASR